MWEFQYVTYPIFYDEVSLLENMLICLAGTCECRNESSGTICSVPDQGILDPVPPSDRDLTGRQPSSDMLP